MNGGTKVFCPFQPKWKGTGGIPLYLHNSVTNANGCIYLQVITARKVVLILTLLHNITTEDLNQSGFDILI